MKQESSNKVRTMKAIMVTIGSLVVANTTMMSIPTVKASEMDGKLTTRQQYMIQRRMLNCNNEAYRASLPEPSGKCRGVQKMSEDEQKELRTRLIMARQKDGERRMQYDR